MAPILFGGPAASVGIYDVVGIPELGHMILGFLANDDSLRNASLVSRRFNAAARPYLWRTIKLPYICIPDHNEATVLRQLKSSSERVNPGSPFGKRFSYELTHFTRSLCLDMKVVAPIVFVKLGMRPWESYSHATDVEWQGVKSYLDRQFLELEQTLVHTSHLLEFAARDVPRVLDHLALLQRHCPAIKSITIAAHENDNQGLRTVPAVNRQQWDHWNTAFPGFHVPLANTVNLPNTYPAIKPLVFGFPNLRILSLTNIQHDGLTPSTYLEPLASVLKASQNITSLELSMSTRRGGYASNGQYIPNHDVNAPGLLKSLCVQYKKAGGKPLRLKRLQLGRGCSVWGNVGRRHFLHALNDWSYLEELHIEEEDPHDHDHENMSDVTTLEIVSPDHLPRLRKLSWPSWPRLFLRLWLGGCDEDYRSQLIIRLPEIEWLSWDSLWYLDTYREESIVPKEDALLMRGLILPSEAVTVQDIEEFIESHGDWLFPTESLKMRLPRLTADNNCDNNCDDTSDKVFRFFGEMKDLCELWLADGRATKLDDGQVAPGPYYSAGELESLAAKFAITCPKLWYLRILGHAWHIVRREGAPELRPLTAWEIENKVPDAFDWRKLSAV